MKFFRQVVRGSTATSIALAGGMVAVGFSAPAQADGIPEGYAYELVSPPASYGQTVSGGETIAPDGDGVVLISPGALEGAGSAPDLGGAFYSRRTATGWRTVPLVPKATDFPTWISDSAAGFDFSADGRTSLWWMTRPEDRNTRRFTLVRTDADGNVNVAAPTVDDTGPGVTSSPIATSEDLRTVVIQSVRRNLATDGAPDTRSAARLALYVSRPDANAPGGFMVRQVAFRAGAIMGSACAVSLGSPRTSRSAVSADGRRIFFTLSASGTCNNAAGLPVNQRVWVRDGDAEPEDLSATLCTVTCGAAAAAYFEGASADGRRAYFTTPQKLLNSDQDDRTDANNDIDTDLYVHDSAFAVNSRLQNVTASGNVGEGAGVLGVVRVSDDGSYVYFVANGRPLSGSNARGDTPQAGDNNLYVYHRPRSPLAAPATIRFVSRLDFADIDRSSGPLGPRRNLFDAQGRPVVTSSDGRYLLFLSHSDLTDGRQAGDTFQEPYRYDAETDTLTRIWSTDPAHNGAARTAGVWSPTFGPLELSFDGARQRQRRRGWMMSDDGKTVAFSTTERLSADDVNDKRDVYMWQEQTGVITMLTNGRSVRDLDAVGVSRAGDVFFTSDAPLVPQHRSGAIATFVARRGGGFAPPLAPPTPCEGDGCQGPRGDVAPLAGGAVTDRFAGSGNVLLPSVQLTATAPKAVRGSRVTVRVEANGEGRLEVRGAGLAAATKSLSAGQRTSVRVTLSSTARRSLARGRAVRATLRVQVQSTDGAEATKRIKVTFRPTTAQARRARAAARTEQGR